MARPKKKTTKKTGNRGGGGKASSNLRSIDAMASDMPKGVSAGSLAVKALREGEFSIEDGEALEGVYGKVVKLIEGLEDLQAQAVLFAAGSPFTFESLVRKAQKSPTGVGTINQRAEKAAMEAVGEDATAVEFMQEFNKQVEAIKAKEAARREKYANK